MIETLFGTLFGGVFRMLPEVMKWLDRNGERKHQLSLIDKQIEADKVKSALTVEERNGQDAAELAKLKEQVETQAMVEAVRAQSTLVNVPWVDALSSMVRPVLAFQWLILLWPAVVLAAFILSIQAGTEPLVALKTAFGVDEKALAASIAAFWLVDRSLRRAST